MSDDPHGATPPNYPSEQPPDPEHNPHDHLVRRVFGQPAYAQHALRGALSPEIATQVDWDTLAREPGSYVDEHLKEHLTDLLFSAHTKSQSGLDGEPVNSDMLLYVLFEHQRSVDRHMAFRCLKYIVRVLDAWVRDAPDNKPEPIPVVVPVIFYNGLTPWSAPHTLEGLYDPIQRVLAGEQCVRLRYAVHDLSRGEHHQELLNASDGVAATAGLVQLLLAKAGREPLGELLGRYAHVLARLPTPSARIDLLRSLIVYTFAIDDDLFSPTTQRQLSDALGETSEEQLMSYAQKLRQEGREEGRALGLKDGVRQTVRRLMRRQFKVLPTHVDERLEQMDLEALNAVLDRIFTAKTVDDALGVQQVATAS